MKHTPGPWTFSPCRGERVGYIDVYTQHPTPAGHICTVGNAAEDWPHEANATVIAASPLMLETLILVQHQLGIQKLFVPLGVALEVAKPIQQAIKAATGENWVEKP